MSEVKTCKTCQWFDEEYGYCRSPVAQSPKNCMSFCNTQDAGLEQDTFDDCTVALIGNRYKSVGYDGYEEDYFELTKYERDLAETEAGRRFMRMTKAEMLSTIGQCLGILIAFLDLRQSYDYLKATMDILKDENTALLNVIKQIEQEYEDADKTRFNDTRMFDRLLGQIPDRIWVE